MKRREAEFCRAGMRVGRQSGTSVMGQHSGWARAAVLCGDLPTSVTPSAAPSHLGLRQPDPSPCRPFSPGTLPSCGPHGSWRCAGGASAAAHRRGQHDAM